MSLASLATVDGLLRKSSRSRRGRTNREVEKQQEEEQAEGEGPVYLRWEGKRGLDKEKFAVLPNDWPYNVPVGVRHYCVWSRVSYPFTPPRSVFIGFMISLML